VKERWEAFFYLDFFDSFFHQLEKMNNVNAKE
ncbi:MAG: hypothetical protein ACJAZG_001853, partial [Granulosicoccus sp.]